MTDNLTREQQQMLMARPWDAADDGSIWEISGDYPKGGGTFTRCIAMAAPGFMTGSESVLFVMAAPGMAGEAVPAAWVTRARELLLVDAITGESLHERDIQ